MGFSQADWQELQINLDKIRFGPRQVRPPPIQLSFLPQIAKPKPARSRPPDEPGYDAKYQLRLW